MAHLSGEEVKALFEREPQKVAEQLAGVLNAIGYTVTAQWVEDEMDALIGGAQPRGGPSMLLDGWLKKGMD